MPTSTQFTPALSTVFQFAATLDSVLHNVIVTWNVSRQDWYINVYDQSGNLVVCTPLVGSPPAPEYGVNLVGGYFQTSSMIFYESTQTFVVIP